MYVYLFVLSPVSPQLSSTQVTVCGVAIREWQHTIMIITGTLHIGALPEPLIYLFRWGQPKHTLMRNGIQLDKCEGYEYRYDERLSKGVQGMCALFVLSFLLSTMRVAKKLLPRSGYSKIPINRY